MPNSIKTVSGEPALQVTRPVRRAGLVEEQEPEHVADDESPPWPTYRARVRVHTFDSLLVVVDLDTDRLSHPDRAELVAAAARDTKTVFGTETTQVQVKGHGYMVRLPPARDAGFREGHTAPVQTAPGVLFIHKKSDDAARLAEDLVELRDAQVDSPTECPVVPDGESVVLRFASSSSWKYVT